MNKRHFILLGIYSVLMILLVVVWVMPTFSFVRNQKDKIYDERIKIEQQTQQFSDTKSLTQQYNKISEDVKTLQAAFLSKDTDAILSFIDHIDSTAGTAKVTDSVKISPLPDSTASPLTRSEITITASGTYPDVLQFLSSVEQMSVYINLSTIEMSSRKESEPNPFTLTLKGSIYWK